MELRELQWFVVLAETEHVTIAAAQLHVSQPTLSRALARLERTLGVRLFDRRQNRLSLNKYGEIFRAHALRAMDEITQAEERITTLVDPERGVVTLGFVQSFGDWLVPRMVTRYHDSVPGTSFELFGGAADAIVEDVRKGRLDVGVVAPRPAADDLAWVPLGSQTLRVGSPPGHRFRQQESVTLADLVGEPMICLRLGYGLRQVTDSLFREAGLTPRIVLETTELSTLRALVLAGMGIAIVPEPPPELEPVPPTTALEHPAAFREYGAVARKYGPSGRAARRFLSFIADDSTHTPDLYVISHDGQEPEFSRPQ